MEQNCLNCHQPIAATFCGHCGQKAFKRIDKRYIFDEVRETLVYTNKGLLYTLKRILKNPGKTARSFIDGTRVNHYKPILLVFVLSGVSAFITFNLIRIREAAADSYLGAQMSTGMMNDYLNFISGYSPVFMLMLVPLFAVFTKFGFRKWGHNYYEHVILNCYILSFYTLVTIIIISPLMYVWRKDFNTLMTISGISYLVMPFILFWFFKNFYPERPVGKVAVRVLATLGWTLAGYLLLMVLFGIFGILYAVVKGPEALEYITPQ